MKLQAHTSGVTRQILIALFAFVSACTVSENQIAGGSGSGNPGNAIASITIGLDTSATALPKLAAQGTPTIPGGGQGQNPLRQFATADQAGLVFDIDSVFFTAQRITLLSDTSKPCDSLLSRLNTQLQCGDSGLTLEGAERFDAMNRTAQPSVAPITVPAIRYSGIVLHFGQNGLRQPAASTGRAIEVRGTFSYRDTVHTFVISCSTAAAMPYRLADSGFVANNGDTVDVQLLFASRGWVSNVDISAAIQNNTLAFEADGSLRIIDTGLPGPASGIATKIRNNILNAGRVQISRR